MKVTRLEIKRQESYEQDPGQLKGIVTLTGPAGQQSLVLTAGSISRIFEVIKEDAVAQAKVQAKAADRALQEAADEPLLIGAAEVKGIGND
jgi:hypothetical protein